VSKAPDWLQLGYPYVPYAGLPPAPRDLLQHWNLDPLLIGALVIALVAYAAGSEPRMARAGGKPAWRRLCFYSGWVLGSLILISPLCALSVSLFSARAAQDMLLMMVVAPLVALGRPTSHGGPRPARFLRRTYVGARVASRQPILAALTFTAVFWLWRAPAAYAATFDGGLVYWLMQLTSFTSALWLWSALLASAGERRGGLVAASLMTTIQISVLAAIITFSDQLLYLPHVLTAAAWGLTPLEDQQLGGVILWLPAGVVVVAALLVAARRGAAPIAGVGGPA
jgi:putative membrane protein